ncbi:TPA: hypothetical protein ACRTM4_000130 [Aeromonas hydrophila]|uniref:hypothetical protein n=1 Tax=Aeromonas TaxID=642 RepID=UPI00090AE702|nr:MULTISPECIES: hypothetical protein [Aeromonas]HEB4994247.1 hypothetical protein [Aeromonas hydrophila subsp. hydrophila]APJ14408.1 hypothetical protein BOQ57_05580 [Aeromonas hydrophila]MCK0183814.1 hypothetical protein [Aeromonas hydrophila]UCM56613.1 hypothetical protein LEO74_16435 [Aeromonas hydrophila]UOV91069.1 hypothetical protein MUW98_17740 [Aeromonas hydrophila]
MRAIVTLLLISSNVMAVDRPVENAWPQLPPSSQQASQVWRSNVDTNDLLKAPKPLSFGMDVVTDSDGNSQVTPYQKLNLTAEKSVSLSFEQHKPRIKFKTAGMNTSIKLRGNGVKLEFSPTDRTIPLDIELKLTDGESSLRFDYRF